MNRLDIIRTVIDALIAAAALIGAITGICGLYTWRRKLRGGAEYGLARRIALSVLRWRDSMNAVREVYYPFRFADGNGDDTRECKELSRAGRRLEAHLLEAEALWGSALAEPKRRLLTCMHKLHEARCDHRELAHARDAGSIDGDKFREMVTPALAILRPTANRQQDEFRVELCAAVDAFLGALRPYLKA